MENKPVLQDALSNVIMVLELYKHMKESEYNIEITTLDELIHNVKCCMNLSDND